MVKKITQDNFSDKKAASSGKKDTSIAKKAAVSGAKPAETFAKAGKPTASGRPARDKTSTTTSEKMPAGKKVAGSSAKTLGKNIRGDKRTQEETFALQDAVAEKSAPLDEKLQKVLARAGVGSRREMERSIEAGQVRVNDRIAKLGDRVTANDKIFVNGHRVLARSENARRRVILYNKPEGEICSRSDPEGRRTVYDGLPALKGERWISVGRLDFNTSGLLLFTNDGEFANKLMHPSSVIDREYLVRIQGEVTDEMRQNLLDGVLLDDGVARFTDIVEGAGESRNSWFYCVVMEGRNREVRRLWESQGVKVSRLKRVRYANIFIPSHVRVGQWIELGEKEISDLCLTAGFDKGGHTKVMQPTRDESMKNYRHEKKLRASSAAPKRFKPAPRKNKPPAE